MSIPLLQPSERRSERIALDASISLRRPGQLNYRVQIFDASLHVCRVEFVERPRLDEQLWVKFDGLQPLEAEVCWVEGFTVGVNFVQPIHPAVFDRLVSGLAGN
ncbi:MAG TPA: PilZ domain-containing protein [Sphingomicrobium sp.]|nr:PilZ domain-containing protein [Sphingomicrobium sp.]